MTQHAGSVADALLDAFLASGADSNNARAADSVSTGNGRVLPTLLGWALAIPCGQPCEFNFVTLYKHRGYVPNPEDQRAGWDACKRLTELKRLLCAAPAAAPLETLIEYVVLLSEARKHIATNDTAFAYTGLGFACCELDFELYMALGHLAARDVARAMEARQLDTAPALNAAADLYERAACFMEEAHRVLYEHLPPADRARHAHTPPFDWIMALAPREASRATAGVLVRARAALMRAEASACRRAAVLHVLADDDFADVRDAVTDGTSVHVAQQFLSVSRMLASNGGARAGIASYAAVVACLLQLRAAARCAQSDVQLAETDKDAVVLARAVRRLEHNALSLCTPEQRKAVAPDVNSALDATMRDIVELRARADALRYDASHAFVDLDLTSALTQPPLAPPLDPALPLDGEAAPKNAALHEVAALRAAFVLQTQRFTAFFALRAAYTGALRQIAANPLSANEHAGRGDFDLLFARIATQLGALPEARRALLASDSTLLVEVLKAMFALGGLAERARWTHYLFATDDGGDPDAHIVAEAQELDEFKLHVSRYLALLYHAMSGAQQ